MSWFDPTGLANIAKTALKEAQRTIDKALDIKDDDTINTVPSNTPIDTNSEDFFSTWGISHSDSIKKDSNEIKGPQKISGSMWGSFTGSFFDNASGDPSKKSSSFDSLDDSGMEQHFAQSKLVVQQSDDIDGPVSRLSINEDLEETNETTANDSENAVNLNSLSVHRREKPAQYHANRLSVVSTESGKNSSESVEIITCSTECTTSPESELFSVGQSVSNSSSAFDTKQTSESLEILGDSLTSPSSVEILDAESLSSRRDSDEFVSPLQSPLQEDQSSSSIEKVSPDSIEIIPEDQDEDTMSYTSISESTVLDSGGMVYLKPAKLLKNTFIRTEFENVAETQQTLPGAITKAPSRSQMHLPLNSLLIDTQPQKQELPNILNKINVIDIPVEDELNKSIGEGSNDDGSQSDKTLIGTENLMESSDSSTTTETSTNSSYLKNMLEDAMTEKQEEAKLQPPRENSPLSSESRSDLVKIGSDHTSGHTSGDELETTTSSDIEIISSPTNGDSSSTQSRQSPAKQLKLKHTEPSVELLNKITLKKAKGHTRELSGASSISDDSSEVDRLLKRIAEMTDILESRESKLIDMNRRYVELQEANGDMQRQLDCVLTKQLESADLSQVTEEYTQRMSVLEKKFQQAIREKDSLRKQLEQSKLDAAMKMSKNELEALISEKDEIIKELRSEGEKLSKQQLQHLNIIKKLRVKEKENENTIKHQKDNIESLSAETERLKRSLTAKEEVERTQIEAVHQLTTKNKKLEKEVEKLKSNLDDFTQKYNTTKKSLDAAKKELIDKNKASNDLMATEQLLENLEYEKKITESQNEEIVNQLDDLRLKLRQSEQESVREKQQIRQENIELLHRLEEAETRNEELSQSVLEVSKPLVRQLESLQATYNMKMAAFEKVEQELTMKINELQGKLGALINSEKVSKEQCISMRSKIAELESDLNTIKNQNEVLRMKLEQIEAKKEMDLNEIQAEVNELNKKLKLEIERTVEKERLISNLEQQLRVEKSVNEMEKKRSTFVQDQKSEDHSSPPRSNSPTLSLGKVSVSESMGSSFWAQDEPFDVNQTPRYTNMFEMQMLQSNLKQREGELQQLQWELSRREQERSLLNVEISNLISKVEGLENRLEDYEKIKQELVEMQQRYDTLCQLYGEKVEENEELKLDLEDVKDMYKSQIDELLRLQKEQN